ncbi:hypothetical protein O3M35_012350 [Rhynocoris fuscipes]|uniref:Glycosyltransferase 2-like domain-containing protein n=1 Tax=Rhynocoris fuscipes TaxID=488301 RepID=A0AAW1CTQ0_9HEMI
MNCVVFKLFVITLSFITLSFLYTLSMIGYFEKEWSEKVIFSEKNLSESKVKFVPEVLNSLENYGNMGEPVVLPLNLSDNVKNLIEDGWKRHSFNQFVSDLISVKRTIPDLRDPWCRRKSRYPIVSLPLTSIIICFYNEAWSVLLRTVHSVFNRSPDYLIKEVILVDDFSDMLHLAEST